MLELVVKNQFNKAFLRMKKRGKDQKKLWAVVDMLLKEDALPLKYRNHKLSGDWESFWECHIEPDWLLIYQITDTHILLATTGTHSDLF